MAPEAGTAPAGAGIAAVPAPAAAHDADPRPVTRLRTFRVLVAVPEALIARGLRALVEQAVDVDVDEVSDAAGLRDRLAEGDVDVCLLDPALATTPGREGVSALLTGVRDACADCGTLVVGGDVGLDDVLGALAGGATGVVDRADEVDLLTAARAAAAGVVVLSPGVRDVLVDGCGPRPDEAVADAAALRLEELTPRQYEVLRCIAAGMRNPQIAEALVISERTVKTHVGHVLSTLGVEDRTQAAVAAHAAGIVAHEGAAGEHR